MVMKTISGFDAITSPGSSIALERLFTKPRPFTLGLNSFQLRAFEITVDQRLAGSLAPVPRVYESP
jgi:hypothetical protein